MKKKIKDLTVSELRQICFCHEDACKTCIIKKVCCQVPSQLPRNELNREIEL